VGDYVREDSVQGSDPELLVTGMVMWCSLALTVEVKPRTPLPGDLVAVATEKRDQMLAGEVAQPLGFAAALLVALDPT
jgi:hypothetical protein